MRKPPLSFSVLSVFENSFPPSARPTLYLSPNSGYIAHYAPLIRDKSPTNCEAHLMESNFQTHSSLFVHGAAAYQPQRGFVLSAQYDNLIRSCLSGDASGRSAVQYDQRAAADTALKILPGFGYDIRAVCDIQP